MRRRFAGKGSVVAWLACLACLALLVLGCDAADRPDSTRAEGTGTASASSATDDPTMPGLATEAADRDSPGPRWDDGTAERRLWTEAAWQDVAASALPEQMPQDMEKFCENYAALDTEDRQFFWVYLLSAISELESGHDPSTSFREAFNDRHGQPVISRGLLQLSIESANGYRCGFSDAEELHDPVRNLACGVTILNRWVVADQQVTSDARPWKGGARYWAVLRKFADRIGRWTQSLAICEPENEAGDPR